VAGAIFSGFAMVLTLAIPIRWAYGLDNFITMKHLENMAKVLLATGLMVSYGYLIEAFMAWYSGSPYEQYTILQDRPLGPYAHWFWVLIFCNCLIPNLFWVKRLRTNLALLWVVSLLVNLGMWAERYVIVVTSLHADFLPSSWGIYSPTWWDIATYTGTIGLFVCLLFLFLRFLPVISIAEMQGLLQETRAESDETPDGTTRETRSPAQEGA
jgi:molybdopterin-containing oxidoreductase family membrane subunit